MTKILFDLLVPHAEMHPLEQRTRRLSAGFVRDPMDQPSWLATTGDTRVFRCFSRGQDMFSFKTSCVWRRSSGRISRSNQALRFIQPATRHEG